MPHTPGHARVDDFESLAKDSNRRIGAKFDFAPARGGIPSLPATPRQPGALRAVTTPPVGETLSSRDILTSLPTFGGQVETLDTIAQRFAQGVPPAQNLARGFFPEGTEFGVDALAPGPRAAVAPATPVGVAPVATPLTPAVPDPTGVLEPTPTAVGAAPTAPAGFTLGEFLERVGPSQTGFADLALFGLGSNLVRQRQSEITTDLERTRALESDVRAEEELASQSLSREAQAGVATASAEKIAQENQINADRLAAGLAPITSSGTNRFSLTTTPADIVTDTPASLSRLNRATGEVETTTGGGFTAQAAGQGSPQEQTIRQVQAFRAANPEFKDATLAEVADEIIRRQQAPGGFAAQAAGGA